jgi:hypothetical protein
MKPAFVKLLLLAVGAILFNIIFWQEKMALNTIIFAVFVLGSVFYLYPAAFTKPVIKWLLLAHGVAAATLLLHNTVLSKIAFSVTLLLVVVFIQYWHRSVWYAAASAAGNYLLFVITFFNSIGQIRSGKISLPHLRKAFRFLIIPLLLAGLFFIVYGIANAVFQDVLNDIGMAIQNFFNNFFSWVSWERFSFLLFGGFITGGLLLKATYNYFATKDAEKHNDLHRKKNNLRAWKDSALYDMLTLFMGRFANGMLALRNENIVGTISLALLNLLLLFVNTIDIIYVWFGFTYTPNLNLKDYVHEGTGMLIFSIVLAMAVLLFFFRGNLNFYTKNKWLRIGAYGWILQNAILVISVLLRDYYYIQHMGLAYKRIGVLVFLCMVLVGLYTVFIKIYYKKTPYYLWRVNGWFAIALLVGASCVHWDETIARYNITHKNSIPLDVPFLLTLSDKALPLLQANSVLFDDISDQNITSPGSRADYSLSTKEIFKLRKEHFLLQQASYSWLSWNKADEEVKSALSTRQN